MRGALRPAPGLPLLRILQGPAGHHRQNGGLIDSGGAEANRLPRFFFMRIVVDVMGGDHGAATIIEGARLALQSSASITQLILVGRRRGY